MIRWRNKCMNKYIIHLKFCYLQGVQQILIRMVSSLTFFLSLYLLEFKNKIYWIFFLYSKFNISPKTVFLLYKGNKFDGIVYFIACFLLTLTLYLFCNKLRWNYLGLTEQFVCVTLQCEVFFLYIAAFISQSRNCYCCLCVNWYVE